MPVPTVVVGDHIKLRLACFFQNQYALNVVSYRVAATSGASCSLQDIADAFDGTLRPTIQPWMPVAASYYGVAASRYAPGPPTIEYVHIAPAPGTAFNGITAPQAAGICRFRTGLAGRSQRGRAYIPFPSYDQILPLSGQLSPGGIARLGLMADAFFIPPLCGIAPNQAVLALEIFHRAKVGPPPVPQSWSDVSEDGIQPRGLGTQRRRAEINRPDLAPF